MTTLHLKTSENYFIEVHANESDKFTETACVKFVRSCDNYTYNIGEIYLSASQLGQMGRFLLRQADEISTAQKVRHNDATKI